MELRQGMQNFLRKLHNLEMLQLQAGTVTVGRLRLNPDSAGTGPCWELRKGEGEG